MIGLNPDNQLSRTDVRILTYVRGKKLRITISRCSTIETMRSTIEDIFRCAKAARESMLFAERKRDHKRIMKDKRFK